MEDKHDRAERKRNLRLSCALVSLLLFVVAAITLGGLGAVRLASRFGFNLGAQMTSLDILIALPLFSIFTVVICYLAIIIWLVFARLFFTKAEVLQICRMGPHTKFDLWLVSLIFGDGAM